MLWTEHTSDQAQGEAILSHELSHFFVHVGTPYGMLIESLGQLQERLVLQYCAALAAQGRGVQQLPAARRARRRTLWRPRPRNPATGRRARLRRRPGGHDHRHRPEPRPGARPGRDGCAMNVIPHIIDGQETKSASGLRFASVDPWTREPWGEIALGGSEDADRAVRAAPPGLRRGSVAADGIRRARHAAAPRRGELPVLRRPCTPGHRRSAPDGHRPPRLHPFRARRRGRRDRPWNLPLMLESWKVALALAWGNTVVLKPAEDSPASATLMARLALEAGLPPGVLNVLHGYGPGSAGAALTQHPGVGRITFTGESATRRVIARAAPANLGPVSPELGGQGGK